MIQLQQFRIFLIAAATIIILSLPITAKAFTATPPDQTVQPSSHGELRWDATPWAFRQTDNITVVATSIIGYMLVAFASYFAYKQWIKDQRWKQIEALMDRIEAFGDTPGSKNAMMMMASQDREIPLWDKERPEDRYVRVSWDDVSRALIPGDMISYPYVAKLTAIRDSFEDFLGRLSHLQAFLEANLLTDSEASHIMDNWVRRFTHLSSNPQLSRNLRIYIEWRGMKKVQDLFARFGVDLKKGIDVDLRELAAEIKRGEWKLPPTDLLP